MNKSSLITIVDYGMGNIKSIQKGFEKVGAEVLVSANPDEIRNAERVVIPGVGAFKIGMHVLLEKKLDASLKDFVKKGNPLLGICLGMQMMMDFSEEQGITSGLGLINGKVIKIPEGSGKEKNKIPHIGWNKIYQENNMQRSILKDVKENDFFYFVHSFMCQTKNKRDKLASSKYNDCIITAAIQYENLIGLQFHPEKSSKIGLSILRNFLEI